MHFYLMRHADPDYENNTLTEAGFAEAEALGKRMAEQGLDYIYSSPTARAMMTAERTAGLVGREIIEHEWLIEPPLKVVQKGRQYAIWDTFGETVRSGASMPTADDWFTKEPFSRSGLKEVWDNFRSEMDGLLENHGYVRENGRYRIVKSNRDRIGIFSHNGTNIMLIAHFLEIPLPLVCSGVFSWPSSVTTIYFEEHSDEWAVPRALGISDVSHLHRTGLKPVPRGLGAEPYLPFL